MAAEGHNKYKWKFYMNSAKDEEPWEKYAKAVQVELHPTFNPPALTFYPPKEKV